MPRPRQYRQENQQPLKHRTGLNSNGRVASPSVRAFPISIFPERLSHAGSIFAPRVVPGGTALFRVYFRGGDHPGTWNGFRHFGPVPSGRFDHHLGRPHPQSRGVPGLSVGFFVIVAAEFIAADTGLGYLINYSRTWFQVDNMMLGAIIIGVLGLTSHYLLVALERHLFGWRAARHRNGTAPGRGAPPRGE